MNYALIYDHLMDRARTRKLSGYSERHHIIPRCLGGTDEKNNIVRLTPEEHYVAHQLLVKIHPDNIKLLWAASSMTNKTGRMRRNNKLYGWLRRKLASAMSVRIITDEYRANLKEGIRKANRIPSMLGKQHSEETKQQMSLAAKGKKKSPEHCAALSAANMGRTKGKPQRPEWIAKRTASLVKTLKEKGRAPHFDDPIYQELLRQRTTEQWEKRRVGLLPPRQIRIGQEEWREIQRSRAQETWDKRRAGLLPLPKNHKTINKK